MGIRVCGRQRQTKWIAARSNSGPMPADFRIVRKGLNGDELVVINGIQTARPGRKVDPVEGRIVLDPRRCLAEHTEDAKNTSLTYDMKRFKIP